MSILNTMSSVLPYKITKKISKTGEGRSGDEIYKRRNRRNYRGLMQYVTWDKLQRGYITPNILPKYNEGCIVRVSPKEYFGSTYPCISTELNSNFILGKTGFVYYSNIDEYNTYGPLSTWKELFELNTKGKAVNDDTWIGDYCLNIKNSSPKKISEICKDSNAKRTCEEIAELLTSYGVMLPDKLPSQCGIGNYDYDYADEQMIKNVQLQMLYMILTCEDQSGNAFRTYLTSHYMEILDPKHDAKFKNNIESKHYNKMYNDFFNQLKKECREKELLDFEKLQKVNAWDNHINRPICPLCSKPFESKNFFEEILQAEGRRVQDNTQKEVVLMHIHALRSGALNHRVYNLGWGHNFCNAIQGDKDLETTINDLQNIISTYHNHTT